MMPNISSISRRQVLKTLGVSAGAFSSFQHGGNISLLAQKEKNQVSASAMGVMETPRNTYQIQWTSGDIELNLIPMNSRAVDANEYKLRYAKGKLMDGIADAVGVIRLRLKNCPPISRICWDSREHQLWTGFTGGFQLRNSVVQNSKVSQEQDGSIGVSCFFVTNDVKTSMSWHFHNVNTSKTYKSLWDTSVTIESYRPETLKGFLQLFACYHPKDTNFYWSDLGEILPCSKEVFCASRSLEEKTLLQSSEWTKLGLYYEKSPEICWANYRKPVLLSRNEPWFGGLRHILMIDPEACAMVLSAHEQARDYWIRPPNRDLRAGERFTARARHAIARVDNSEDLQTLWEEFERSISAPLVRSSLERPTQQLQF
jgi:hypothetical protein